MKAAALLAFCLFAAFGAPTADASNQVADLALEPHSGAGLPLDAQLIDETGAPVSLADFFTGQPVMLVFEYLHCRTICGIALGNLAAASATLAPEDARGYRLLAISIDPRDTPADAAAAKRNYLARYSGTAAAAWHFLTGPEAAVKPIADAAGFHYRYDATTDQYIHSAGIVIAAPDGTVRDYLGDIDVTPATFVAAIDAARSGQNPGIFGRFLLLCFGGDTGSGRYTPLIEASLILVNIAAMLTACALFLWVRRRPHP